VLSNTRCPRLLQTRQYVRPSLDSVLASTPSYSWAASLSRPRTDAQTLWHKQNRQVITCWSGLLHSTPPRHIGSKTYELRDLDVFEFSFVAVGANRTTSVVAVKAPAGGTARLARAVRSSRCSGCSRPRQRTSPPRVACDGRCRLPPDHPPDVRRAISKRKASSIGCPDIALFSLAC